MFLETTTNNLRRRVAMAGSILIVSPMIVMMLAGWAILQRVEQAAAFADRANGNSQGLTLSQLAINLVAVCRQYHQTSIETLKRGERILSQSGPIRLDSTHMSTWHANNELTGESKLLQIPLMTAGDARLAPAVDAIAKALGTPATIFQRLNDQGDMLRVASTRSDNGNPAIGTFIPAESRTAESAKVLQTVLSGQTYIGKEVQGKVGYLTAYQPLRNTWGAVVGMLNTVLPEEEIKTQVKLSAKASAQGAEKPQPFILEASGEREDEKDASGESYVQEMLARGEHLAPGQLAEYKFEKAGRAGTVPKTMTAQIAYVPEFAWVVGFSKPAAASRAALSPAQAMVWAMWSLFAVGVVSTGLAVRVWIQFSDDLALTLNSLLGKVRKEVKQISAAAVELTEKNAQRPAPVAAVPSNASILELLAALDQITLATNHLMVTAANEAATSPTGGAAISKAADEFRALAQRCRNAAHGVPPSRPDDNALAIRGQAEALRRLAAGIDRSVEAVTSEVTAD